MDSKKVHLPRRIMIAAGGSGSGKTVVSCALLRIFSERGYSVTPYKCGPDYIDPMFHKRVLGISGGNLDTFFVGREGVCEILSECDTDYALIEGVMGIYDGIGGVSVEGSSYDVAESCDIPIILLVDAYGLGRTLISVIRGILSDDKSHLISGIILNGMSKRFYDRFATLLGEMLSDYDVRLIGFIPRLAWLKVDSRHLGLKRPDEIADLADMITKLAEEIKANCDIEAVLDIADEAIPNSIAHNEVKRDIMPTAKNVRLAVAYDEAFCFYYRENLKLLEFLGAEIVYFSPLHDEFLPDDIDGIYIGGGYPELYLRELSDNTTMLESVKFAIESEVPSIAECGGFMYLCDYITDEDGVNHPMVGVVAAGCRKGSGLSRFGYVTIVNDNNGVDCNALAQNLSGMKGHEFHYYDSTDNGNDMMLIKAGEEKSWRGMHIGDRHIWGYAHMYLKSKPSFAQYFVGVMRHGK